MAVFMYCLLVLLVSSIGYDLYLRPVLHIVYAMLLPEPSHVPTTNFQIEQIQSTLVISTSFTSNNRLSRSENLVPISYGNLTTGNKILQKRGEIAPLFRNIFNTPDLLVRLSLLTMTNPNQLYDVLLFVCSKMADETNLSSKLPVAHRPRAV